MSTASPRRCKSSRLDEAIALQKTTVNGANGQCMRVLVKLDIEDQSFAQLLEDERYLLPAKVSMPNIGISMPEILCAFLMRLHRRPSGMDALNIRAGRGIG